MMMGMLVPGPLPVCPGVASPVGEAATAAGFRLPLLMCDPLSRKAVVISAATAIPAATGRNAPGLTAPAR